MYPKFDLTGVQTHDLQIMRVDFMSLRQYGLLMYVMFLYTF